MINRRPASPPPSDKEIAAVFQKIRQVVPADKVQTITKARDSLAEVLSFCLGLFSAWEQLQLAVEIEAKQTELDLGIKNLQKIKKDLKVSLETNETETSQAIETLKKDLETQKNACRTTITTLKKEIQDLETQKTNKETEIAGLQTAYEAEFNRAKADQQKILDDLNTKASKAETRLANAQKAFEALRTKLDKNK